MSYAKFENFGRKLIVREGQVGHTDRKLVGIRAEDQSVTVDYMIDTDDAPAVALAILEAAGIDPSSSHEHTDPVARWSSVAAEALAYSVKHRAEQAEREAEDAKVREYTEAVLGHGLPETYRLSDLDRRQYRAAREFFTREEKPAPRVLQYGDPEPGRDTK